MLVSAFTYGKRGKINRKKKKKKKKRNLDPMIKDIYINGG